MNSQKFYNKYDIGIILLIASLVVGDLGGALQPVRVVSLVFMPQVLIHFVRFDRLINRIFLFFLFWLFYIIISLSWTSDFSQGVKEFFYYISHFSLFFLIQYWAYKAINPFRSIILGWLTFFLLSCPFAFYELIYDRHLASSQFSDELMINAGHGEVYQKKFSALNFLNYNTYVTVLCFAMPFLFSFLLLKKTFISQIVGWVSIMMLAYIQLMNASRGGVICLVITSFCFFYYYRKVSFRKKWLIVSSLLLVVLFFIIPYWSIIIEQFALRFVSRGSIMEDTSRSHLIRIALDLFTESYGVGTGVGSIMASIAQKTTGVIITHNLFLELLVQYGIVIFSICVFFCIHLYYNAYKKVNDDSRRFVLYSSLFSLPFVAVINSGYLLMPSFWAYFSCLTFFSFSNVNFWPYSAKK